MKRALSLLAALAAFVLPNVAQAAFAPTVTVTSTVFGSPGAPRIVQGYVTLSASDTYVTGGFSIVPAQIGLATITAFLPQLPSVGNISPIATLASNVATVKLQQPISGASNIAATATTATVTVAGGLSANTPILCQLDDAATGGGGTGTWAVTNAVSSCKYASATTFTITSIAAAPTNGGNFTYSIPTVMAELASSTSVASLQIPFVAAGF